MKINRSRPFNDSLPAWLTTGYPQAVPIVEVVMTKFQIGASGLFGRRRFPRVARARMQAMTLCYDLLELSLVEVGTIFDRDHTTVMHAIRVCRGTADYHRLLSEIALRTGRPLLSTAKLHVVFTDPPEADGAGDVGGVLSRQGERQDRADEVRRPGPVDYCPGLGIAGD
jgi:hypothetical protein